MRRSVGATLSAAASQLSGWHRSISGVLLVAFAVTGLLLLGCASQDSIPFDPALWKAGRQQRPVGMGYDIVRRGLLDSKTTTEVTVLLGSPDMGESDVAPGGDGFYVYSLRRNWYLEVSFEDGRSVVECDCRRAIALDGVDSTAEPCQSRSWKPPHGGWFFITMSQQVLR